MQIQMVKPDDLSCGSVEALGFDILRPEFMPEEMSAADAELYSAYSSSLENKFNFYSEGSYVVITNPYQRAFTPKLNTCLYIEFRIGRFLFCHHLPFLDYDSRAHVNEKFWELVATSCEGKFVDCITIVANEAFLHNNPFGISADELLVWKLALINQILEVNNIKSSKKQVIMAPSDPRSYASDYSPSLLISTTQQKLIGYYRDGQFETDFIRSFEVER